MSPLGRRVMYLVRRDVGLTVSELAAETGEPVKVVQSVCFGLARRHLLDICWPYFTLPPAAERAGGSGAG